MNIGKVTGGDVEPYADHLALLEDHLARIELLIRAALIRQRRDQVALGSLGPLPSFAEGLTDDPEVLESAARVAEGDIRERAEKSSFELPIATLQEQFSLDDVERDIILLALAPSLDPRFSAYFDALGGSTRGLDVGIALVILAPFSAETVTPLRLRHYFAADGRLLSNHLISLDRRALDIGASYLTLTLRLPMRVTTWLMGEEDLDASLHGFSRLEDPKASLEQVILPSGVMDSLLMLVSGHDSYLGALDAWGISERVTYGRGIALLFVGSPGTGKTLTAKALAQALGKRLLLVDPRQIADLKRPIEDNLSDIFREARLQNAVVFFDECESLFSHRGAGNHVVSVILSSLEHYDGVVILSTNTPEMLDPALDRRVLFRLKFEPPTPSLRKRIWEVHLPPKVPLAQDVDLGLLARQYEFTGGYIKNAVLVAVNRAVSRGPSDVLITQDDLDIAARTQLRARLSEYADITPTTLRLTDLILPEETRAQVQEILEAARSRTTVFQEWGFAKKLTKGRGLSALFDGEPGTGKTLCAEILASELGLTLYRINVANVVSKYIGETEKNLTRIFREADDSHCLLLFDEADALFSQRTDVKSVHDKYANMEINVLLQLMENYEGLVLLTTNLKKSIDKAFERRLSFKVGFPFPEPELREQIWKSLIPSAAPVENDIEHWILARSFELSGGSIKNAIIRAAYRAAAQQRAIAMSDLVDAAKYECAAAGKLYRMYSPDEF